MFGGTPRETGADRGIELGIDEHDVLAMLQRAGHDGGGGLHRPCDSPDFLQPLNLFDPEVAIAEEFALGKTALCKRIAQLPDPALDGPDRLIRGKCFFEFAAVDSVAAWVRAGTVDIAHTASRHQRAYEIGQIANAVILARPPDIEGLVVDRVARGREDGEKRPTEVLDVDERSPGRAVALDHDFAGGAGIAHEVVDDDVGPQPR